MSEAMVMQTGGQLLGSTLSATDPTTQSAVSTAFGLVTKLGRELPHSRKQESEADHIGLLFMARAGYNPDEAVHFWERFQQVSAKAGQPPVFLSTHPHDDQRIADLKKELPQATAEYNRAQNAIGR